MNTANAVLRAAPLLAQHGDGDPSLMRIHLIRAGLTTEQIHDAVRFIPLAFGREILDGMGVILPDTYIRVASGEQQERKLEDEPFFREARRLAASVGGDVVTTVAVLSSELQAVNAALNAGVDPAGLVAGPSLVECEVVPKKKKPWWMFWG